MDLRPTIWISSISHLENYGKIVNSASFREKFVYNYNLPSDFPRIKNVPSLYFSRGEVKIKNGNLIYTAFMEKNNSNGYYNLQDNLSFTLNHSNIKSIKHYHYKNAFGRSNRHWIRIICNEDIIGGDFLICADSVHNTENLFKILNQIKEFQEVTVSLTNDTAETFVLLGYVGIILCYIPIVIKIFSKTYYLLFGATISTFPHFLLFIVAMSGCAGVILTVYFLIWYFVKGSNEKVNYHMRYIWYGCVVGILIWNMLNWHS